MSGEIDHEGGVPTGYDDLIATLNALPVLVRHKRRVERLALRVAAAQSGTNFNTISRTERGEHCSLENAIRLFAWLNGHVEPLPESEA